LGRVLAGRTVWNVNSAAAGGGVAETLQVLVGYARDLGIPAGWLAISGDAEFFAITKRLRYQIHGTRRPPGWPRRWRRRAPGWCGTATSGWTGTTR
jgi:trehalose synthase